jgi:hypothetical protein
VANKDQYTAKDFIDAIPHTGGVITLIAQKVGCSWNTAKKYIEGHVTVKQAYDDEVESILDLGEAKLFEAVKGGEFQAIKYLLSTRGKKRGYVERIERDDRTIDLSNLTDEQIERLSKGEDLYAVLANPGTS